jgi:hypothetical protein
MFNDKSTKRMGSGNFPSLKDIQKKVPLATINLVSLLLSVGSTMLTGSAGRYNTQENSRQQQEKDFFHGVIFLLSVNELQSYGLIDT